MLVCLPLAAPVGLSPLHILTLCGSECGLVMYPPPPDPGVVKQDKAARGSVDTTKTRSGPQRVRMSSGERPIGAAKGKQSDTEALCQPPPPPPGRQGGVLGFRQGSGTHPPTPPPPPPLLPDSIQLLSSPPIRHRQCHTRTERRDHDWLKVGGRAPRRSGPPLSLP